MVRTVRPHKIYHHWVNFRPYILISNKIRKLWAICRLEDSIWWYYKLVKVLFFSIEIKNRTSGICWWHSDIVQRLEKEILKQEKRKDVRGSRHIESSQQLQVEKIRGPRCLRSAFSPTMLTVARFRERRQWCYIAFFIHVISGFPSHQRLCRGPGEWMINWFWTTAFTIERTITLKKPLSFRGFSGIRSHTRSMGALWVSVETWRNSVRQSDWTRSVERENSSAASSRETRVYCKAGH